MTGIVKSPLYQELLYPSQQIFENYCWYFHLADETDRAKYSFLCSSTIVTSDSNRQCWNSGGYTSGRENSSLEPQTVSRAESEKTSLFFVFIETHWYKSCRGFWLSKTVYGNILDAYCPRLLVFVEWHHGEGMLQRPARFLGVILQIIYASVNVFAPALIIC